MDEHAARPKCLPTYLVIDTSDSMSPHAELLNDTIDHVFEVVGNSPRISEFAHISIITFNTRPYVVLEMTDIAEIAHIPTVRCQGTTRYGEMFAFLRKRISLDIDALVEDRRLVLRPAVFILTDGVPSDDDWATAFGRLADAPILQRPHIIPYGFGQANSIVLDRIATDRAYLAAEAIDDSQTVVAMLSSFLDTLVASATLQAFRSPTDAFGYSSARTEQPG